MFFSTDSFNDTQSEPSFDSETVQIKSESSIIDNQPLQQHTDTGCFGFRNKIRAKINAFRRRFAVWNLPKSPSSTEIVDQKSPEIQIIDLDNVSELVGFNSPDSFISASHCAYYDQIDPENEVDVVVPALEMDSGEASSCYYNTPLDESSGNLLPTLSTAEIARDKTFDLRPDQLMVCLSNTEYNGTQAAVQPVVNNLVANPPKYATSSIRTKKSSIFRRWFSGTKTSEPDLQVEPEVRRPQSSGSTQAASSFNKHRRLATLSSHKRCCSGYTAGTIPLEVDSSGFAALPYTVPNDEKHMNSPVPVRELSSSSGVTTPITDTEPLKPMESPYHFHSVSTDSNHQDICTTVSSSESVPAFSSPDSNIASHSVADETFTGRHSVEGRIKRALRCAEFTEYLQYKNMSYDERNALYERRQALSSQSEFTEEQLTYLRTWRSSSVNPITAEIEAF
ncbi:hypothetical protein CANCADRAFT_62079 [Tortispora caseinolytica NRRL Y-17796]|uniref:Uncharacterized protein n=1 Tax=Tortispora caseinolytica NRRL Y-17796 TaxID=767744 RepID=A0A1E4TB30_9ASCO|nr:hypothetical protein CANCADRAFT_62079 [Tortispora caseinolytica NRRL Y-17796]